MNPFESDYFSANKPIWHDCFGERADNIRTLIVNFFPALGESIYDIKQVGGIEINSNNFCIETSEGKFLLKKWGNSLTYAEIVGICELSSNLSSKKIPVSTLIPAFDQSLAIKYNNQVWSLFKFDEGLFFSGSIQELISVAEAVGLLFNNLAEINLNFGGLKMPEMRSLNDFKLFKDYFSNPVDVHNIFQEKDRELLISNKELLQKEVELVFNSDINLGRFQFSHFDLHPHNILMKDGELSSFLDLDSIRLMHSGYALGFVSLKLCRQSVVNTGKTPKEIADIWMGVLSQSMTQNNQWIPFISELAIADVLRRIAIILRLNIVDRNPQWNAFLSVQLNHLQEARLLFNS